MVSRRAVDSPQDASQPIQQAPDSDASLPPDQPAGTSADASQPGVLRKAWDTWTSRPENNAAMINFGLQLMQPIGPGQSRLGHWGEAIGAGAEASSRNVAEQQTREETERKADLAERKAQVEEERGSAYSEYMRNRNIQDKFGTQRLLKQQGDWNRWRTGKDVTEDLMNPGRSNDTTVNLIRQSTGRKDLTKSQILNDPALASMAERIIKGEGGGGGAPGVQEGATATGPGGTRIIFQGGRWQPLATTPPDEE
jgi:hypothetical protein